jgi:DNA modification methylase
VFIVNKGGDVRTGHQTQKPLALMEILVRLFSDPGELILDPFAGSGTTGVAAVRLGRRFIGWEMSPEYAEIARRRLAVAREQLEIGF